ncbi:MAG: 5-formyltetrahydrofolate cyclo-ligase [Planctomycetes bacterium]|nr:5-formyltetrahydrofolate cyclo-ligase [Planctomycetota bacterium]
MADKTELRQQARTVRDRLEPATRRAWSQQIADHGTEALRAHIAPGTIVSAYWPMRSEADPRPLASALGRLGATLCLPAFVGTVMEFRQWRDGDALVPAGFQTFEPPAAAPVVRPGLVLAPLLAFDRRGTRLGWGKGYYDTWLGAADAAAARGDGARALVVGIAFACQEVVAVPCEPHDRRLDAVVTEQGCRWW